MLKKSLKALIISVGVIGVLCALPIVAVQVALSDKYLQKIVDKVPGIIGLNGEIKVGHIDYSIYKTWPNIELSLNDVVIISKVFEPNDTLLSATHLSASVSAKRYLSENVVQINSIDIVKPVLYGRKSNYKYNWEIIASDTTEIDTVSTEIPSIFFEKVKVSSFDVKYVDEDDLYSVYFKNINLNAPQGHYTKESIVANLSLRTDSIVYENTPSLARYTVAGFGLDAVASDESGLINVDAKALSPSISITDTIFMIKERKVDFSLKAAVDTSFLEFKIDTLLLGVDDNCIIGSGDISVDTTEISAYRMNVSACVISPHVGKLMGFIPQKIKKQMKGLNFDGDVDLDIEAKGLFSRTSVPVIKAKLAVKDFNAKFDGFSQPIDNMIAEMEGLWDNGHIKNSYLKVNKLCLVSGNSDIDINGDFCYKKGREHLNANIEAALDLHTINDIYRVEENSKMSGKINADISTNFFFDDLKQMNVYNIFSKSTVNGDGVNIIMPEAGVDLYVDSLRYRLNTNTEVKSRRRNSSDTSLVNTRLTFKKMKLNYRNDIKLDASRFSVSFLADDIDSAKVPRVRATVSFRGLNALYNDTVKVFADKARASININKDSVFYFVPNTTLALSLDSTIFSTPEIGAMLKNSKFNVSIQPRFRRRKKLEDGTRVAIPFNEQKIIDLKALVSLFDSLSKSQDKAETYVKLFRTNGDVVANSFRAKSPLVPLRFGSRNLDVKFSDDTIRLNNFSLGAGKSRFNLKGEVINLRRWALRGRELSADFTLKSRVIDLNQIVRAAYAYNERVEVQEQSTRKSQAALVENNIADLNVEDETMVKDSTDSITSTGLVVLPKNVKVKFSADVDTVRFSNMELRQFKGIVSMKDQVLRIRDLSTSTQIGDARANMLYKCISPDVAQVAGLIEMDSVQIGDIEEALPELDTIMPMLRSLEGSVTARASFSSDVDSTTSIVLPSVSAGLLLRGDSLVLMDGETFSEIAKMLMFSKKTKNRVDSVSVELVVKNNEIDIYPFMFAMDKYRLAVGGTQGLDMSFNYHVALLKPVILGLDVYGSDFDHIKFKLSSVRFKNANVSIGKGGTLIRGGGLNLREALQEAMERVVLEDE